MGPSQTVTIEKPLYGGSFLARLDGKAIFVPLVLPGEEARIRITERKKSYETAEPEGIVHAAPVRVQPPCPHFGLCGGCHYQHADYPAQLALKKAILREMLERGGADAPAEIAVLSAGPWAYRNRIRLALDAQGNIGYRGRRSHQIIPIVECPIAAPVLVRAAEAIARIARRAAPAIRFTEVSLFCDAAETAVLATLTILSPEKIGFDSLCRAVSEETPALKGAELVLENPRDAHVQKPRVLSVWGAASLAYRAAGFDYRVDHGAFFQVNRWLVDSLVERVTGGYTGALAWDLFAGVGLFARKLTASFERVVAVESAPASQAALAHNLRGTDSEAVNSETLPFLRSRSNAPPELIIVDPPRMGLGSDVTALLGEIGAPSLVYVSCDPATLARDLRALLGYGYAIESLTFADLFPQTFHLETVVALRRG
jgi:23S rRNA (uracil1939-C5)-methyltransferase